MLATPPPRRGEASSADASRPPSAAPLAGCDVRVGDPRSLWLLWLVPPVLAFYVYSFRTRGRLLRRFASAALLARLTAGVSRGRQALKAALVLLGLAAALLALAELRWGFTWEEVKRQGVDIVVALDVSDSMLVEDVEAGGELSRLERAKREITDLLRPARGRPHRARRLRRHRLRRVPADPRLRRRRSCSSAPSTPTSSRSRAPPWATPSAPR